MTGRSTAFPLVGVVIVLATLCSAQSHSYFAIVRYNSAEVRTVTGTRACAIVGEDGQYHMELTPWMEQPGRKNSKVYVGKLSQESLARLQELVRAPELQSLGDVNPPIDRMVLAESLEMISLRLLRESKPQELGYVIRDHKGSIPESVRPFVSWLKDLMGHRGEQVKGIEPNSCRYLEAPPDFRPQLHPR